MSEENTAAAQPLPARVPSHRSYTVRLRTAAASSVLAAVSVTGIGVTAAAAREPESPAPCSAAETRTVAGAGAALGTAAASGDDRAGEAPGSAERLAGVRRDLANAVSWGSVTAGQAEAFYAQISSRIARGL